MANLISRKWLQHKYFTFIKKTNKISYKKVRHNFECSEKNVVIKTENVNAIFYKESFITSLTLYRSTKLSLELYYNQRMISAYIFIVLLRSH